MWASRALLAGLAVGAAVWTVGSAPAQETTVTFATVEQAAARLAAEPYRDRPSISGVMRGLSYDQYRALRFTGEPLQWRDSPFRAELHPAGFLYDKPVSIAVVDGETATPLSLRPDMFDFGKTGVAPPAELAVAGFRLNWPLHGPKPDEIVSFLGASYYRPIGRDQVHGASARGLAIDTATARPEEFPAFRAFWLVKPQPGASDFTVWALLESPGAAGAYAFRIRPGQRTVVDTRAVLFARHGISLLGVAPLTSMFFTGKTSPPRNDFRPEVHDSDGLMVQTGSGERIWRPLSNPAALAVSSFLDTNPRGFGLLQRERSFAQYQDTTALYHARPSLWVEPEGDWGEGEVRLVEIPTAGEHHDNIVAFWAPRAALRRGQRLEYRYRTSALADEASLSPRGRVVSTRLGAVPGWRDRRIVVEFAGGELPALGPEQPVTGHVWLSNGKAARTFVERLPWQRSWRMVIDVEPDGRRTVDMRAYLGLRGEALTETWTYVLRP
jgi:glucans biosynthesis protein